MKHVAYTQLFRNIAAKHKALSHTENDMHFVRMIRSGGPFPNLDLKEFIDSIKTKLSFPALVLESYDATYNDNRGDNWQKRPEGGFIILDRALKADFNAIDATLDRTEEIGEDILGYLRRYFENKMLLFDLNQVSSERIDLPVLGLYGTRFNFSLPDQANTAIFFNPTKWHN